jgi:hypothetical protein
MTRTLRILGLACALAAPAALAEYNAHVFYGASQVEGDTSDHATDGYTFGFGGVSRGDGMLAWRWDFAFDHHDAREGNIASFIVDDGDLMSTYFRFGPQLDFETGSGRFYLGVSAGYYWTYANISMYATVPGYVCDPFWGWCWLVPVSGEFILADRSEDDLGYSATVGYEWDVIGGSWFIEAQYHLIEHGEGYEIMPVVIGLRF